MHNAEFHNLYCKSKKSDTIGKECGMHGNEGNVEEIIDWKMGRKESIQRAFVNVGG
jgi:hypothetical protein